MKVILAEKPSVARDLASFVNARRRCDGYFEGAGYQVTWALGHLVELKEPDDYDPSWKKWSLANLPIVPKSFELRLRGDERARQQFGIVKKLFRSAQTLISATDAGREGELIFRYILTMSGCVSKPAQRLWLSSLTSSAIAAAFANLRPLSDFDDLYEAARCRSEADWIVGLNATRNYTVRHRFKTTATSSRDDGAHRTSENGNARQTGGLLLTLGRVQTPVLAMIVRRDDEIRTFIPRPFHELKTKYREVVFTRIGDRFDQLHEAQEYLQRTQQQPFMVTSVSGKKEQSPPPQLFDLTQLQREMNRRCGFSAADTLAIAQKLYEGKWITYPRTDSVYLSHEVQKEVPRILQKLRPLKSKEIAKLDLDNLSFGGRIVNDKKVSDHHAIIPTGSLPAGRSDRDSKVYDAIVTRFIAAFYPACVKQVTVVEGQAGLVEAGTLNAGVTNAGVTKAREKKPEPIRFRARGVVVISAGWTELYPKKKDEGKSDDSPPLMPKLVDKETGPHEPFVFTGETVPPKHFTENTLLAAMDTAGRLVDDVGLREALKEKGLGTPATRAATIETLLRRRYLLRERKNLIATNLGRYLIAIVREPQLTSPELTGEWEAKLNRIEAGQASSDEFMREIVAYTDRLVRDGDRVTIDVSQLGPCPLCGEPVVKGKRDFGCSAWRTGCGFILPRSYRETELSVDQIRQLLQQRAIDQPMKFRDGGAVLLTLTTSGKVTEVPIPSGTEQDPRAGTGASRRTISRGSAGTNSGGSNSDAASTSAGNSGAKAGTEKAVGVCPVCGSPVMEQPKSYTCVRWREGCGTTVWKTISGKRITQAMAKKLLRDGKTGLLKGFRSKNGNRFDARLKFEDGRVRFVFDQ